MLDTHAKNARQRMVDEQLIPRGIRDPLVLKAMRDVPRHCFVQSGDGSMAYSDRPLPIGNGQTISQPYIVALMTESLELTGDERVLEIGTGSGYQAGAPDIPEPLKDQLAPGGRLIIPVGDRTIQELVRITKGDGELHHENLCGCRFVPLRGAHGW